MYPANMRIPTNFHRKPFVFIEIDALASYIEAYFSKRASPLTYDANGNRTKFEQDINAVAQWMAPRLTFLQSSTGVQQWWKINKGFDLYPFCAQAYHFQAYSDSLQQI